MMRDDDDSGEREYAQGEAMFAIRRERERQYAQFGTQVHDPAYWLAILGKQVGQLGEAVIKHKWRGSFVPRVSTEERMYHEACQVAAVAVAMMEAIALSELPNEVTSAMPKDPRQLARALDIDDEDLISREHARMSDDADVVMKNDQS